MQVPFNQDTTETAEYNYISRGLTFLIADHLLLEHRYSVESSCFFAFNIFQSVSNIFEKFPRSLSKSLIFCCRSSISLAWAPAPNQPLLEWDCNTKFTKTKCQTRTNIHYEDSDMYRCRVPRHEGDSCTYHHSERSDDDSHFANLHDISFDRASDFAILPAFLWPKLRRIYLARYRYIFYYLKHE